MLGSEVLRIAPSSSSMKSAAATISDTRRDDGAAGGVSASVAAMQVRILARRSGLAMRGRGSHQGNATGCAARQPR